MIKWRDESGETLIESLTSISIVGFVLLALIAAVTLSMSLTTILKAQSASQTAGRSIFEAVSAYTIPKSTPLVVSGVCNTTVTNNLTTVATAAASGNTNATLNSGAIAYNLVVIGADSSGNPTTTLYPCSSLGGHPLANAGESAAAIEVDLPVTATGHVTFDSNGNAIDPATGAKTPTQDKVTTTTASFPATLKAYVYQSIT